MLGCWRCVFVRGGLADFEVKEVVGFWVGVAYARGEGGTERACGWVVEGGGVVEERRGEEPGVGGGWDGDTGFW